MLEKTRDNEIHVEKVEEPPAKSIAFGLERLGLVRSALPGATGNQEFFVHLRRRS